MNSDTIKNRGLQTDLMRNASEMLRAVACMDDGALQEISDIVVQIEKLADTMENRIAEPEAPQSPKPQSSTPPQLTLVHP